MHPPVPNREDKRVRERCKPGRIPGLVLMMALLGLPAGGWAADDHAELRRALKERLGVEQVRAIRATPVDGLLEVVVGSRVIYATPDGRHLLMGRLIDLEERADLTARREQALRTSEVAWSDLPLEHGVSWGDPEGLEVAVFSDPQCPYCRKLHTLLRELDGVRVHELMMPLAMHDGARADARRILCAEDPAAALHAHFDGEAVSGPEDCAAAEGVARTKAFAREQGWTGTPVVVRADGTARQGLPADSPERLEAWLRAGAGE
jgi:thiol:disulfide interchange protein DsbC